MINIGIDIGGTEIKGGIVEDGKILHKISTPTNAQLGIEGLKSGLHKVISELLNIKNVKKIGISTVGNIDVNTGICVGATDFIKGLVGFNFKEYIQDNFHKEVRVENDAHCALIGEMNYGSGKGYKNICMLTLGTGVGGAVAVDGKVLLGKNFVAGRLGHMILYPNGKKCNCGRNGCVESYLSGRAFTNGAKDLGYNIHHGKEVFELVKKGDKRLEKYVNDFFTNLVFICQSLENIFNPDIIIIGGGMANSYDDWKGFFLPYVKELSCKIVKATLNNDAGIIGASCL